MIDFERYWQDCVRQDREALRTWFCPDARISWPCTGEIFTVEEFLLKFEQACAEYKASCFDVAQLLWCWLEGLG